MKNFQHVPPQSEEDRYMLEQLQLNIFLKINLDSNK